MRHKGLFITFEGPDGSGKSTVLSKVYEVLKSKNYSFHIDITREPGGRNNVIAEDIRNILLNKIEYKISPRAEALLFAASRAQHVQDFIKPNLEQNHLVLCDRYIHSSLAYQGYARKLGAEEIWNINTFAINGVLPDLTIVLMLNPEKGIERIHKSKLHEFNRLDQEEMNVHQLVYDGYQQIINEDQHKTLVKIDATKKIEEVCNEILKIITNKIKEHYGE